MYNVINVWKIEYLGYFVKVREGFREAVVFELGFVG